jgi:aminoglycoside 6'-N-acetyltransferase
MQLRTMATTDLELVAAWLGEPHVARWYLVGSTVQRELEDLRLCIAGVEPTEPLMVVDRGRPIGWCQWYLCDSYPEHAAAVGALPGEVGIDYAIGDPNCIGVGLGTVLVSALVAHARSHHPRAGVITDPEAANVASRRVLEKNGFHLVEVRPVMSEPTTDPMAIYRLSAEPLRR